MPNERLIKGKRGPFTAAPAGLGSDNAAFLQPQPPPTMFDHWRHAEHAAMLATRALCAKSIAAMDGACDLPTDAERLEVLRLRRVALQRFDEAMAAMRQAARGHLAACARPGA